MTTFAPGDLLAALGPAVPRALVSPEALDRATSVARLLPQSALWASLECRLGKGEERVDFSACVPAAEGGCETLGQHRDALLGEPLSPPSRLAWERIFAFCAEWERPGSLLAERIPFVFIEFDLDPASGPSPPPFVLFHLQPRSDGAPGTPRTHAATPVAACRPALAKALLLLDGAAPSPQVSGCLERCLEALPAEGCVAYAAPLSLRGSEAIRLMLILPRWQVLAYLRHIEWDGPLDDLERDWATLPVLPSEVWFDLDVGETVAPRVGMVFSYPAPGGQPRWRVLLDQWVERGHCTAEKRDAVLAWPGHQSVLLPGLKWPLSARRSLVSKIVYRRDRPPEAKIYLESSCRFSLLG